MIICYYSKDSIIELKNNCKIQLKDLKIGDQVKCADANFNHQNHNIVYHKITDIFVKSYNSTWNVYTQKGNIITCSLSSIFKTITCSLSSITKTIIDETSKYSSHMLADIFDDYEGFNEVKNHRFVLYNYFDELQNFEPNGKDELVGFNIEGNNSVFINDFLVG